MIEIDDDEQVGDRRNRKRFSSEEAEKLVREKPN